MESESRRKEREKTSEIKKLRKLSCFFALHDRAALVAELYVKCMRKGLDEGDDD